MDLEGNAPEMKMDGQMVISDENGMDMPTNYSLDMEENDEDVGFMEQDPWGMEELNMMDSSILNMYTGQEEENIEIVQQGGETVENFIYVEVSFLNNSIELKVDEGAMDEDCKVEKQEENVQTEISDLLSEPDSLKGENENPCSQNEIEVFDLESNSEDAHVINAIDIKANILDEGKTALIDENENQIRRHKDSEEKNVDRVQEEEIASENSNPASSEIDEEYFVNNNGNSPREEDDGFEADESSEDDSDDFLHGSIVMFPDPCDPNVLTDGVIVYPGMSVKINVACPEANEGKKRKIVTFTAAENLLDLVQYKMGMNKIVVRLGDGKNWVLCDPAILRPYNEDDDQMSGWIVY